MNFIQNLSQWYLFDYRVII